MSDPPDTTITSAAEGAVPNPFEGMGTDEILAEMAKAIDSLPPPPKPLDPSTVWIVLQNVDEFAADLGITRPELLSLLPQDPPLVFKPFCREPDLQVGDAVGHEASWCLDQIEDVTGEQLRRDLALDLADRLAGPCDWCREEDQVLHIDGGLALCCECSPGGA